MIPRHLATGVTVLTVLALAFAALAPATAQGVEEPLLRKADEKTTALSEDPQGAIADQATEERLAEDANWTIAYGCYLAYTGTDEAGLPPPDIERCGGFEDAIGVSEEQEAAEEAAADAQQLQDDALVEATAIAEDLEDTTGEILDDPAAAPAALQGFLERTVRAIERLLAGVGTTATDTLDGLTGGLGLLMQGAGIVVAAPVAGVLHLADAATTGTELVADGIATSIRITGDAAVAAATATVETAEATADGFEALLDDIGTAVRDTFDGLFGDGADAAPTDVPPTNDLADRVRDTGDGLLDPVDRLVEDTARTT